MSLPLATSICCHSLQPTWKVMWSRALRSPPNKTGNADWPLVCFLPSSAAVPDHPALPRSFREPQALPVHCTFDLETGVASEYWWHMRCWFQPVAQWCCVDLSGLCSCFGLREGWMHWALLEVWWCLGIAPYPQASCGSSWGTRIAASEESPRAEHFRLDGSLQLSSAAAELIHLCSPRDGNGSGTVWSSPREWGGCMCMEQLCREADRCPSRHHKSESVNSWGWEGPLKVI